MKVKGCFCIMLPPSRSGSEGPHAPERNPRLYFGLIHMDQIHMLCIFPRPVTKVGPQAGSTDLFIHQVSSIVTALLFGLILQ